MRYGYTESEWQLAKSQMSEILREVAARRGMITYGELSQKLAAIAIGPHDSAMAAMLGEVSGEEDAAGRGMLSALVVHKYGDMEPGSGFFEFASSLGRDVSDRVTCWVTELHKVHDQWANR